jgi:hypothetical protein
MATMVVKLEQEKLNLHVSGILSQIRAKNDLCLKDVREIVSSSSDELNRLVNRIETKLNGLYDTPGSIFASEEEIKEAIYAYIEKNKGVP